MDKTKKTKKDFIGSDKLQTRCSYLRGDGDDDDDDDDDDMALAAWACGRIGPRGRPLPLPLPRLGYEGA